MKLWQVALFAYAVFYFVLAGIMEAENLSQSYPIAYIAFSMVAQTLVVGGVALFGLKKVLSSPVCGDGCFRCSCWSSQSASCSTPPTKPIPAVFG